MVSFFRIVICLAYFCVVCGFLAAKYKKEIFDVVPFAGGIILLSLYVLAFFNKMFLVELVEIIFMGGTLIICKGQKEKAVAKIFEPFFGWAVALIVLGIIFLSDRAVSSFDEFNFWAVDAKSMFFLNGFSEKGLNCAPAYGDYPPIPSIISYFFMHILGRYDEGMMMGGQFAFFAIFLSPLLGRLPKHWWTYLLVGPWMITFSAFLVDLFSNRSPDVLMGMCFACIIFIIFENYEKDESFSNYIVAVLLAVLVLIKSVGIEWWVFAIVFSCILCFKMKRIILWTSFPLCFYGSWLIYCKIMERKTYLLTGYMYQVENGVGEDLISWRGVLAESFLKALVMPLQKPEVVGGMSVSVLLMLVISIVGIVIFHRCCGVEKKVAKKLIIFFALLYVIESALLLYSVETMFLAEAPSYADTNNMLILLKRYGAPALIGSYTLLWGLLLLYGKKNRIVIATCMIICIISSPLTTQVNRVIGYRYWGQGVENNHEISHERTEHGEVAYGILSDLDVESRTKLAILIDAESHFDADASAFQYYSAPVPVVLISIYSQYTYEDVVNIVKNNGCDGFIMLDLETEKGIYSTADGTKISSNVVCYVQ